LQFPTNTAEIAIFGIFRPNRKIPPRCAKIAYSAEIAISGDPEDLRHFRQKAPNSRISAESQFIAESAESQFFGILKILSQFLPKSRISADSAIFRRIRRIAIFADFPPLSNFEDF
jgi:hypothetical protein